MSAILRAAGVKFDIDRFCAESNLIPEAIHRRGAAIYPTTQPEGKRHDRSNLNILVSERDFSDFPGQVMEATEFLLAHRSDVSKLVGFPGVEGVVLDFGLARRDVVVQTDHLPPGLILIAGELGLGIDLSYYPIEGNGEQEGPPPTSP